MHRLMLRPLPRIGPHRHAARRRRVGFTLVELLVTISIITLLASMVLVALAGVQETARADRTRAQIARIDTLITEKWESFRGRRVPLPPTMRQMAQFSASGRSSKLDAARVDGIRELMRMELPDRKTDILIGPAVLPSNSAPATLVCLSPSRRQVDQRAASGRLVPADRQGDRQTTRHLLVERF